MAKKPVISTAEYNVLKDAVGHIEELSANFEELGIKDDESLNLRIIRSNPFAGLLGSPHLDKVQVGEPLLSAAELSDLRTRVEKSKTDREEFVSVIATLAQIGASIGKALS